MPNYYVISRIIGKKITHYRKMNGMSLHDLAKIISVSEQQQSRYERGINRINLDRLRQFADIFNIDISQFFILDDYDKKEINEISPSTFNNNDNL